MNFTTQKLSVPLESIKRFTAADFVIGKHYRIKYRDIYSTHGGLIPGIEVALRIVAPANAEAGAYGSLPAERGAAYWSKLIRVQMLSGRVMLINPEDIASAETIEHNDHGPMTGGGIGRL